MNMKFQNTYFIGSTQINPGWRILLQKIHALSLDFYIGIGILITVHKYFFNDYTSSTNRATYILLLPCSAVFARLSVHSYSLLILAQLRPPHLSVFVLRKWKNKKTKFCQLCRSMLIAFSKLHRPRQNFDDGLFASIYTHHNVRYSNWDWDGIGAFISNPPPCKYH